MAVGRLLQIGVSLAAAVVLVGAVIYLARHGGAMPHYGVFRGEPTDLRTLTGIAADALTGRGRGIIQLGLLLLVLTPIARVAFSVIIFFLQRDHLYIWVTLIVLSLLLFGLLGGA